MKKLILAAALLAVPALVSAQECETYDTEAGGFTVQTCRARTLIAAENWTGPAMCRKDRGSDEIICPDGATFDRPPRLECAIDGGKVFCWDRGFNTPLLVHSCQLLDGLEVDCANTDAAAFLRRRDR